jgi:hypothetical protein
MRMATLFKILGFLLSFGACYHSQGKEIKLDYRHLDFTVYPSSSPYLKVSENNPRRIRYSGIFAQDDSNRVWFFVDSEVWFFSLIHRTWTKYAEITGFDDDDHIHYNSVSSHFIIWNDNGSSVRTWKPGQLLTQSILNSEKPPIYMYHSGSIDNRTGNIIAMGGRGFGIDTGLIWTLNSSDAEWRLVPISSSNEPPPPRHSASTLFHASKNQLHLFAGASFKQGRRDVSETEIDRWDYWTYNFDESIWSQKIIFGLSEADYDQKASGTYRSRSLNGLFDPKNDLIWFHYKGMKDAVHSLIAFDLRSGYGIHLPVSLLDRFEKPILRHMSLDPITGELILFWSPWVSDQNQSLVRVSVTKLPDADMVRSMIATALTQWENTQSKNNVWENMILILFLAVIPIFGGSAVYLIFSKKGQHRKDKESVMLDSSIIWTIVLSSSPTIKINGKVLDDYFSKNELHLLCWMSWKFAKGNKFQLTDTIESFFFHEIDNLDYLRKQRNNTFKRINEQLNRLCSKYVQNREWISDRYLYEDRRKREYALQLEDITIEVEYDLDQLELELSYSTNNQQWLKDIREDLLNESPKGEI